MDVPVYKRKTKTQKRFEITGGNVENKFLPKKVKQLFF